MSKLTLAAAILGITLAVALQHGFAAVKPSSAPIVGKQPIPNSTEQSRAEQTIRKLFAVEYRDHSPAGKMALAKKLLEQGAATATDLAARYISYRDARDLAASSGDLVTAFNAIDAMDKEFVINAPDLRATAYATATPLIPTEECPAAVEGGLSLLDPVLAVENFTAAQKILTALEGAATRSKQLPLVTRVQSRKAEVVELQRYSGHLHLAREILKKDPSDPAANLTVGQDLALQKGDWDAALPLLAKGSDATLKALAIRELVIREMARPADAKAQLQLANGWWDLAEKQPDPAKTNLHIHAQVLYRQALPGLPAADKAMALARVGLPVDSLPPAAFDPNAKSFTNTLGMKFVRIEPGEFTMGSPVGENGRKTDEIQHRVKLTKAFMMASTVVTQAQWKSVMGDHQGSFQGDDLPVEKVNWDDAVTFCKKLSEKEGKTYRLPTEAEWEYACRAGTTTAYFTGDDEPALNEAGWYRANSEKRTHPVGEKKPNALGLFDMHGNVWQWCSDYFSEHPPGDAVDPSGPSVGDKSASRVVRGGSWDNEPKFCRAAYRNRLAADNRSHTVGFRLCLDF